MVKVADVFATLVIASSMLFLVYDSLYLLRRYLPSIVRKINTKFHSVDIEEDPLDSKTISIGSQQSGGNDAMDRDDH